MCVCVYESIFGGRQVCMLVPVSMCMHVSVCMLCMCVRMCV